MIRKLSNKNGFTLSEMLMVVLILMLIVIMLGSGLGVIQNSYNRITLKAEGETLISTTISKVTDELRYARNIKPLSEYTFDNNDKDTITYQSNQFGGQVYFVSKDTGIEMKNVLNNETMKFLTDKTMTDGLIPKITKCKFTDDGENGIFDITVTIFHEGKKFTEQSIKVVPLNNN